MPTNRSASTVEVNGYAARAIRLAANLSVDDVARPAGITGAYLRLIESGEKKRMSPVKFGALMRALTLSDRRAILAHPHPAVAVEESTGGAA